MRDRAFPPTCGPVTRAAVAASAAVLGLSLLVSAQEARRYALESAEGLRLHNVSATPATLSGKKSLRVVASEQWHRTMASMTPEERDKATKTGSLGEQLAVVEGLEFGDGVIEAEVAGDVEPGVFEGARGFVGIAFRVQKDLRTYDAFYLRPTNGRADDQVRRNHAVQYIAHPDWTWFRLRNEAPSKYEAYVDLVAGEWTKVRIEVRSDKARLFVHDQPQPTLIVNDVRSGASGRGAVALWIDASTVAHFRNLTVTPGPGR